MMTMILGICSPVLVSDAAAVSLSSVSASKTCSSPVSSPAVLLSLLVWLPETVLDAEAAISSTRFAEYPSGSSTLIR